MATEAELKAGKHVADVLYGPWQVTRRANPHRQPLAYKHRSGALTIVRIQASGTVFWELRFPDGTHCRFTTDKIEEAKAAGDAWAKANGREWR